MEIKAVLFDCDGLMFNTEQFSQKMWQDEAAKYNTVIPASFFTAITGAKADMKMTDFYHTIPHFREIYNVMHWKRFDLKYWASFYPDGLNKKGLMSLLDYLDEHQIKKAVCSSSSKEYVETLLETVSKPMHFDAVIGGDMVSRGKPDPEIFLKGAAQLQTPAENCMVLEDSKLGIMAAKAAGMHSCFIQDTIEPDEEMRPYIEFQKNDLSQVIGLLNEGE